MASQHTSKAQSENRSPTVQTQIWEVGTDWCDGGKDHGEEGSRDFSALLSGERSNWERVPYFGKPEGLVREERHCTGHSSSDDFPCHFERDVSATVELVAHVSGWANEYTKIGSRLSARGCNFVGA